MKKALVVFLILAVAGGLFAQISWSGSVETGIGFGFDDSKGSDAATPAVPANKPLVDYVQGRGEHGFRADVTAGYTSSGLDKEGNPDPYGKWGGALGLRAQAGGRNGSVGLGLNGYNVWWQPTSSLYLAFGDGANKDYGTPGGLGQKNGVHDAQGLKVALTPISGLSIGAHAFYGNGATSLENMNIGLGVNYTMTGLVSVVANFRYKPQPQQLASGASDDKTVITKFEDNKFDAAFGANFLGLSALGFTKLAADVSTYNWGAPIQSIGVGEAITFKALDNLLELGLTGQQYFWMGDGKDKRPTLAEGFIPMRYNVSVSYTMGKIVPAIQARYTTGAFPGFNWRDAGGLSGVNTSLNTNDSRIVNTTSFDQKDLAAFAISPQVTFNFGPQLIIGYNLQMDLSEGATNEGQTNTSVVAAANLVNNRKMQHLIYATVKVSF